MQTYQAYIEEKLAPRLQGDGGWVEVTQMEGDTVTCVFRGECSKCNKLERCVAWMESEILRATGRSARIQAIRKKPYFWDVK